MTATIIYFCGIAVSIFTCLSAVMIVISILKVGWKKALGNPWATPFVAIMTLILWIGPVMVLTDAYQLQVWAPVSLLAVLTMGGMVVVRIIPKLLREWKKNYPASFKRLFEEVQSLK